MAWYWCGSYISGQSQASVANAIATTIEKRSNGAFRPVEVLDPEDYRFAHPYLKFFISPTLDGWTALFTATHRMATLLFAQSDFSGLLVSASSEDDGTEAIEYMRWSEGRVADWLLPHPSSQFRLMQSEEYSSLMAGYLATRGTPPFAWSQPREDIARALDENKMQFAGDLDRLLQYCIPEVTTRSLQDCLKMTAYDAVQCLGRNLSIPFIDPDIDVLVLSEQLATLDLNSPIEVGTSGIGSAEPNSAGGTTSSDRPPALSQFIPLVFSPLVPASFHRISREWGFVFNYV